MKSNLVSSIETETRRMLKKTLIQTTEEALKIRENQYHQLVDLSPEAIIIHSQGKLVYVNQSAIKLLGAKSKDELLGMPIMELIHPDFIEIVTERINTIYLTGKHAPLLEEKFIRLDGSVINVEVTTLPFEFNNKLSIQLILRDITVRKKEEERQKFLDKLNKTLFISFNETLTLRAVAKQIVPFLADYCRIVVVNDKKEISEIAVNHKNPKKVKLVTRLYEEYKDRKSMYGVNQILSSRKAEIISKIDQSVLNSIKDKPKLLNIVKRLALRSYMGTPLIARKKIIGAIIFSSTKPNRYYDKTDLSFAKEIASRTAVALDNSRLYNEAHEEIKIRKHAEERLELAQSIGNIGTFELDTKTEKLYFSKEQEEIYGLKQGTFSGKHADWQKMIHPADKKRIIKEALDKRLFKGINEREYRIIWPDKSIHWIHSKSKAFFDEKGKVVRRIGVTIDITERKQIETNLNFLAEASKILSSSLDFQTTLNNVAFLAVPIIADWCVIDILNENNNVEQVAVAHIDTLKIRWAKEVRRIDPVNLNAPTGIANVIRTGKSEIYPSITEKMIKSTAKTKKHLKILQRLSLSSVMIVPFFREGKCAGTITFVSAESKKHYAKTDLIMAEELANRATLALENAWLYKKSQDAISMRDDFISVASHELKTPITSLKIFTQILKDQFTNTGDGKAVLHLAKMEKQLNKITELIYDLLNISKLQAGRMEFNNKYFDFDNMIKDNIEVLQEGIKHRIIMRGKTHKKVYGDEDRIGQVLINLISNAVKYSPKADKLMVRLSHSKNEVSVGVEDYGIGIPKEHVSKIFERFYRVFDKTDKTFPGLGIGLYISNEIIERHGGKLWVESEAGKGSKFFFSLPLKKNKGNSIKTQ